MVAASENTPNKTIAALEKAVRSATSDPDFKKLSENTWTNLEFKPYF